MNKLWQNLAVLCVFLTSIGSALLAVSETLGWSSLTRRKLVIRFPEVRGLKKKHQVTVLGMVVGEVTEISIPNSESPSELVKVTCEVLGDFVLREGYKASLESRGLIAIPFIDLNPGGGQILTAEEEENLYGTINRNTAGNMTIAFHDVRKEISTKLEWLDGEITFIDHGGGVGKYFEMEAELTYINGLVDEWRERTESAGVVLRRLRAGEGVGGELIVSDSAVVKARRELASWSSGLRRLAGPKSALMSRERAESLVIFLKNARRSLAEIKRGEGLTGRLVASEEQRREWRRTVANFRGDLDSALAGESGLGRALVSRDGGEEIRSFLAEARGWTTATLGEIEEARRGTVPDGGSVTFGRLVADRELRAEIEQTLADLEDKLRGADEALTRSRERAAVNTFGGALLSPF